MIGRAFIIYLYCTSVSFLRSEDILGRDTEIHYLKKLNKWKRENKSQRVNWGWLFNNNNNDNDNKQLGLVAHTCNCSAGEEDKSRLKASLDNVV